ncbi:hypothetical protein MTR_7g018040 [Medicago truncatula]|uniref:Uncharacterized protein n=1 Tax=Medicago truncatula TaxID=3880 RepID=A0A072TY44_MEDTR|nr:hypothetical protein MTR_7g018040 [Medicago truncatula]
MAWATFLMQTLKNTGNSYEFRLISVIAVHAILNGDDIDLRQFIAESLRRINNEGRNMLFTFGHYSIINAICEGACVKGAMPRRHHQGVEQQQPYERYDKLTLRMPNAIVDRSKAIYVPMNQFEGDP